MFINNLVIYLIIKTNIMKLINEDNWRNDFSVEYNLIKKATSRKYIKQTLKTAMYALLFMCSSYVFMYAMLYAALFIMKY